MHYRAFRSAVARDGAAAMVRRLMLEVLDVPNPVRSLGLCLLVRAHMMPVVAVPQ
jgi:hypothetical protein